MLEDNELKKLNETNLKNLAINFYSCIKENGKKINYMSYIKSRKNDDCNNAILRMFPKIDINKINNFLDSISSISEIRKEFYKKIIYIRYEIISQVYSNINNK